MTSISIESKTTRSAKHSTPLKRIFTRGHPNKHLMSPPGDCVKRGFFSKMVGMPCFATNFDDIKECDAQKSNNTVAGAELTKNLPRTTSGVSSASWVVTRLTRPLPKDWLVLLVGADA